MWVEEWFMVTWSRLGMTTAAAATGPAALPRDVEGDYLAKRMILRLSVLRVKTVRFRNENKGSQTKVMGMLWWAYNSGFGNWGHELWVSSVPRAMIWIQYVAPPADRNLQFRPDNPKIWLRRFSNIRWWLRSQFLPYLRRFSGRVDLGSDEMVLL